MKESHERNPPHPSPNQLTLIFFSAFPIDIPSLRAPFPWAPVIAILPLVIISSLILPCYLPILIALPY